MDAQTIAQGFGAQAIQPILDGLGASLIIVIVLIIIVNGVALYKAARLQEKVWFWVMLITSTMGVVPLIYLYLRRGKKI